MIVANSGSATAAAAKALLIASAIATVVSIPVRIYVLLVARAPSESTAAMVDGFAGLSFAILQLLAILQFSSWLKHVYGKLPLLSWRPRYTPAMALATFLVPFSNLFRASDVVGELIAATDPARISPDERVHSVGSVRHASLWWYLFLAAAAASNIASGLLVLQGEYPPRPGVTYLMLFAMAFSAVAALLAVRFVNDVEDRLALCRSLLRRKGRAETSAVLRQDTFHRSSGPADATRLILYALLALRALDLFIVYSAWRDPSQPIAYRWLVVSIELATLFFIMTFITWVYRAAGNLRRMRFISASPSYLAFGFVLPVVNLVHPYWALQMLWRAVQKKTPEQEEPKGSSAAVTIVWLTFVGGVACHSIALALTRRESFDNVVPLLVVSGMLLFASQFALQRVVRAIDERLARIEFIHAGQLTAATEAALRIASAETLITTPGAKRASWTEVLLPIAASVDEGIATESAAEREERQRLSREQHEIGQRERRLWHARYRRTIQVTRLLRVVMLLSLIFAEVGLVVFIAMAPGISESIVIAMTGLTALTVLFGLPTWLMFGYWMHRTRHNVDAIENASEEAAPRNRPSAIRFLLGLRPTPSIRALCATAFGDARARSKQVAVWHGTLRLVQATPLVLTFSIRDGLLTTIAAATVGIALLIWTAISAKLALDIDQALEARVIRDALPTLTPLPAW